MARSRNHQKSREDSRSGRELYGNAYVRLERMRNRAVESEEVDLDFTGFRFEPSPRLVPLRWRVIRNGNCLVIFTGKAAHACLVS
jgi:hypothetical protein